MGRNATFAVVLALALSAPTGSAVTVAQNSTPAAPTPPKPAVIPFTRLTPDAKLPVGLAPGAAAAPDAVWTADPAGRAVIRLDAKTNTADPSAAVGGAPCASLAVAFDTVWVPLCASHSVARVALKDRTVSATLNVDLASPDGRIADAVGSLWMVTNRRGVLSRVDPDSNAPVAEIYVAGGATAVVAGENALWVTSEEGNRLTRVSPHTNETIETIEVGPKPGRLAVGEGGV